jgi:ABC-type multidrug transport system ATPase subunit
MALCIRQDLLIFDEPTDGLDPLAQEQALRLLVEQVTTRGTTVFFSTHRLEEVEALASRVLVLDSGKLALTCLPAELAGRLGLRLTLKLIMPEPVRDNALNLLHAAGFTASRNGIGLRVDVLPTAKLAPVQALLAEKIEVNNFELENGA